MAQEGDDIGLLTEIASLYYEENFTQERIARVIGVSRSAISRLLTRAREIGLVDIHVQHLLHTSSLLRASLIDQFGLQDAQVLLSDSPDEVVLSRLGELAARYIDQRIQEVVTLAEGKASTIGISWGTTLYETLRALHPRRRQSLNIVQLLGSVDVQAVPGIDGPEIARQLASLYGGRCYYLHAPLLVADDRVRDVLVTERGIDRAFRMMEQIDIALIGIGGLRPSASGLFGIGYLSEKELGQLEEEGAVGDMFGYYFTLDGQFCAHELLRRTIAVPLEAVRKVPLVIAIASSSLKVEALQGALRTGLIHVLITDEECARQVLGRQGEQVS